MEEQLPDDNDVVIFGTGMTESIVSAALSRIDLRVLNLDRNEHYGSNWGSFNLKGFRELIENTQNSNDLGGEVCPQGLLDPTEKFISFMSRNKIIRNVCEYSQPLKFDESSVCVPIDDSLQTKDDEEVELSSSEQPKESQEEVNVEQDDCVHRLCKEIVKKQRYFTIDLLPKMMYCRGPLVELLISSDVARYCEFKLVTRILTFIEDSFQTVPSSRSEVFSTTSVGVIDKRMLMKFLNFAVEFEKHEDEYKGYEPKSFVDFLKEKKLSPVLQHYIRHAIAMVTEDASIVEGLKACQKYLISLGRYGNSAFLTPLYGTGELLQCFCRLSSVFGGVYCLRRNLLGVIAEGNRIVAVVDSLGQRIKTKWLLVESSSSSQFESEGSGRSQDISRAIIISDRSICPDKEQHTTLANIQSPCDAGNDIIVQEFSPSSRICPENFHTVHLTCNGSNAESDLGAFVEKHFDCPHIPDQGFTEGKPKVIWMVYFNIEGSADQPFKTQFENLIVVPGPDAVLDCDSSITQAEEIFKRICPDKDFLPRAPSPEEIVFYEGTPAGDSSLNGDKEVEDGTESEAVSLPEDSESSATLMQTPDSADAPELESSE